MENYKTIKTNGIHEIEIKKSRFITHLKRVNNETEAQAFIESVRKEHWKATHNCTAYTLGLNDEIQRYDDDGEPSGTAGIPMLELLKSKEIKDVAAVVTRYFGGIKLGAGGLIRAYGGAVNEAIKAIGIVERQRQQFIDLTIPYHLSGQIENYIRQADHIILDDTTYTEHVTYHCVVPIERTDAFKSSMIDLTNDQCQFKVLHQGWIEIPIEAKND